MIRVCFAFSLASVLVKFADCLCRLYSDGRC